VARHTNMAPPGAPPVHRQGARVAAGARLWDPSS
jgi:hypothetical protein